jgi:CheY-like chemotaxis protein
MTEMRCRILLIEADAYVREILAQVLEDLGSDVVRAGSGREGLAILRKGLAPRLVLLDPGAPLVDGVEFLEELRALPEPEVARAPVVVMTVAPVAGGLLLQPLPFEGTLAKPFGLRELQEVLVRFCRWENVTGPPA